MFLTILLCFHILPAPLGTPLCTFGSGCLLLVQSPSRVLLFKTPWNAAPQAILMSRWQNSSPRSCFQASGSPQLCPGPLPVHVFHVLSDPTQSPGFTVELINVDLAFRCVSSCLLGSSTCVFSSLANLGVQKHTLF